MQFHLYTGLYIGLVTGACTCMVQIKIIVLKSISVDTKC